MTASEAGGDLALIQTSLLFSCNCQLITKRRTWFTQQKQWGLYQNKVTSSLAAIQKARSLGRHPCKFIEQMKTWIENELISEQMLSVVFRISKQKFKCNGPQVHVERVFDRARQINWILNVAKASLLGSNKLTILSEVYGGREWPSNVKLQIWKSVSRSLHFILIVDF